MQWLSNSQEFKPNVFSLFAISSAQPRIGGRPKRQDPERNDHCSLPGLRRSFSKMQQRGNVQLQPVQMPVWLLWHKLWMFRTCNSLWFWPRGWLQVFKEILVLFKFQYEYLRSELIVKTRHCATTEGSAFVECVRVFLEKTTMRWMLPWKITKPHIPS